MLVGFLLFFCHISTQISPFALQTRPDGGLVNYVVAKDSFRVTTSKRFDAVEFDSDFIVEFIIM